MSTTQSSLQIIPNLLCSLGKIVQTSDKNLKLFETMFMQCGQITICYKNDMYAWLDTLEKKPCPLPPSVAIWLLQLVARKYVNESIWSSTKAITLFRFIFHGIFPCVYPTWGIYCGILLISQNIVMDLNNVMGFWLPIIQDMLQKNLRLSIKMG